MSSFDWNTVGLSAIEAVASVIRLEDRVSIKGWVSDTCEDMRDNLGFDISDDDESAMLASVREAWDGFTNNEAEWWEALNTYPDADQQLIRQRFLKPWMVAANGR